MRTFLVVLREVVLLAIGATLYGCYLLAARFGVRL